MTKEYLENILTEYGVAFTDSLADRLLKEFEACEDDICGRAVEPSYNSIKTELNGDMISRQAVLEITAETGALETQARVKALPPVTQQTGVWVEIDDEPHEVWECDHCGFVIDGSDCIEPYEYLDIYKYCPNCGAKMDEPQERSE